MKRWRIEGEPPAAVIEEIAAVLAGGGVALLPTDTIYGLHAISANQTAVDRIAAIKSRDEAKRFVVIAASAGQLREAGVEVPATLDEIWPAPLTAVLRQGDGTIAARVPDLPWLRRLLERTGPLVSTSANRSGQPPVETPDELARELQLRIDAILDTGRLRGNPSAIVDFTGDEPRLIREGEVRFTQKLRKTLRISL